MPREVLDAILQGNPGTTEQEFALTVGMMQWRSERAGVPLASLIAEDLPGTRALCDVIARAELRSYLSLVQSFARIGQHGWCTLCC